LHAAIRALPLIYQRTLLLHDLEGYTHGDISRLLGVPIGTSKSRLMLARRRVRAALPRTHL
jgi:RNA polymerase sigma-70 factor (ECF subfamily)